MKRLAAFIIAVLILITPCFADPDISENIKDAVPENVKEIVGEYENASDVSSFFDRISTAIAEALRADFGKIFKNALSIIAVALICSVLQIFSDEKAPYYIGLCACAAVTLICVSDIDSYFSLGTEAINDISLFSKALLPALCTANAACGAISASAVKYAASALFLNLFIDFAENIILPLIYAFLAASIAASAFNNKSLAGVASVLKWAGTGLMTLLSLVFTVYLSVSSAIASSGDAVASKLAKTAISTAIPVVGSIISDAASSVVAGAELIRNTMGAFGMFTVLAICISPIIIFGLNYLIFKAAAVGIDAFNVSQLAGIVKSIGSAFGMMLGLVGFCGMIMFISILSCIRAAVG